MRGLSREPSLDDRDNGECRQGVGDIRRGKQDFRLSGSRLAYGDLTVMKSKMTRKGLEWWLMPVIPALRKAKVSRSLEPRSLRPAWATR